MAQQARPHWYTQRRVLAGGVEQRGERLGQLAALDETHQPSCSDPAEDPLAPGVEQAEGEDDDEDDHLDEPEAP